MSVSGKPPRRGLMLVLSSPSGAGKSTIARHLMEQDKDIVLSVSVTTRSRRPSEIDGVHYHFIDLPTFNRLRDQGDLLEWAEVHGNCYGTPKAPVERALSSGLDVLFDIDWQGADQVAHAMPEDLVRIFVLPPTMKELAARLERRAEDTPDVIAKRLANARAEIRHWRDYDYVLINKDLQTSLEKAQAILYAERMRRARTTWLEGFVESLLEEA
ncbi:guanylate kinase [Kaistia dalseonensis]|uniref:Guanylate kinase n=1 Tax=Kaistia dalseonensis TaxID=410840 RepID=A0ABU0H1W8_9HYPH|nr:guanylate kinase [Kaistia dalseonensis]MCX5493205.1 guanylate kinase [Kaistia dalseonensis]MDQ0435760.1 guanylate kinase [Kaistia dalseonensis]